MPRSLLPHCASVHSCTPTEPEALMYCGEDHLPQLNLAPRHSANIARGENKRSAASRGTLRVTNRSARAKFSKAEELNETPAISLTSSPSARARSSCFSRSHVSGSCFEGPKTVKNDFSRHVRVSIRARFNNGFRELMVGSWFPLVPGDFLPPDVEATRTLTSAAGVRRFYIYSKNPPAQQFRCDGSEMGFATNLHTLHQECSKGNGLACLLQSA